MAGRVIVVDIFDGSVSSTHESRLYLIEGSVALVFDFENQIEIRGLLNEDNNVQDLIKEAELIVNLSNDSWFGRSVAAFQHLQIVRVRAAELERPIIRATNTGISAIINHKGDVIESSEQFEAQVISGEIVGRIGSTPYAKVGERGVAFLALGLVLFALLMRFFSYRYIEPQK